MSFELLDHVGAAVETTLSGAINDSAPTINITAATGWPTGGANGDFFVTINEGQSNEERVRIASRSGTALTVATSGRGVDGTAASAHSAGETIVHTLSALEVDWANSHYADTALDHHSQYLNTARHDVEARHAFGGALGTPSAAADIGTVASAGSGDDAAREDHVHKIGAGAINSAGMFAAGVVDAAAIATDAVGTAEIAADAVTAAEIAANAVGASELADNAVDTAAIADDAVTQAELADASVGTAQLIDANVTAAKLAAALPQGVLGYVIRLTNQTGLGTSTTDLTSLTVTTPVLAAGRLLRITGSAYFENNSVGASFALKIREGATLIDGGAVTATSLGHRIFFATLVAPSAAAHTYKLSADCSAGTFDMLASAGNKAFILVEDIGAA